MNQVRTLAYAVVSAYFAITIALGGLIELAALYAAELVCAYLGISRPGVIVRRVRRALEGASYVQS